MLMFLLTNWKYAIIGILLSSVVFLAWVSRERGYAIESMKVTIAELTASKEQCAKDKKITEETSHEYQSYVAVANAKLKSLRMRHASTCIMPITRTTTRRNEPAGTTKPSGQNGIVADALLDIAADGEKYRLQLKACQDFVNKTWEGRE